MVGVDDPLSVDFDDGDARRDVFRAREAGHEDNDRALRLQNLVVYLDVEYGRLQPLNILLHADAHAEALKQAEGQLLA